MKKQFQAFKYLAIDVISALVAWFLFLTYKLQIIDLHIFNSLSINKFCSFCIVGTIWLVIYIFSGFYIEVLQKSRIKEFFTHLLVSCVGVVMILFVYFIDSSWFVLHQTASKLLVDYFLIHFTISVSAKMILMSISKYQIRNKKIYYNSLLIGCNDKAKEIFEELESKNIYLGLKLLAYLDVSNNENTDLFEGKLKRFVGINNINKIIRRCHIEQVIIAIEPSEHIQIANILTKLEGVNVKISIIPDMYQMLIGSVSISHVLGLPLIEIKHDLMPTWQRIVKRMIDVIASLVVLVLGFPMFVFIGIITKYTSSGGAIYKQERIGKYGVPFYIYKFRSMYEGAEKQGYALSKDNDPRITPWGRFMRKTRLDELPQFFNVLIGEMSLVGPRPERQYFIDKIMEKAPHYKHIIKVKPGITSLGMVKFGYAENVDQMIQRLEFDVIYIENMSLLMDFRILIYTILTVVSAKGK